MRLLRRLDNGLEGLFVGVVIGLLVAVVGPECYKANYSASKKTGLLTHSVDLIEGAKAAYDYALPCATTCAFIGLVRWLIKREED